MKKLLHAIILCATFLGTCGLSMHCSAIDSDKTTYENSIVNAIETLKAIKQQHANDITAIRNDNNAMQQLLLHRNILLRIFQAQQLNNYDIAAKAHAKRLAFDRIIGPQALGIQPATNPW